MSYRDTIIDNCDHHSEVSWWPKYAYHYTDISNALHILSTGKLYSRDLALSLGLMENDNANEGVISETSSQVTSCVRFYFRPLTPTQYHNEGYKHPHMRYGNAQNANMSVPVFFLFDLEKMLEIPGIQFSEKSLAGNGGELKSGEEEFARLNFDMIYSNGTMTGDINEIKKYRHAEIVVPNQMDIAPYLKVIICRNVNERTTLLNLLKNENYLAFQRYERRIKKCKPEKHYQMWYANGFHIKECRFSNNNYTIEFSDEANKRSYDRRYAQNQHLPHVRVQAEWVWWKANKQTRLHEETGEYYINYRDPGTIYRTLPEVADSELLECRVYIEDTLVCVIEHAVNTAEIL